MCISLRNALVRERGVSDEGDAAAVLLRALAPIDGLELMRAARPRARRDRDLCSGRRSLCQALGIGPAHNGVDLTRRASPVRIRRRRRAPPESPIVPAA
jgi:DNA-3-methyladenine glycosylase